VAKKQRLDVLLVYRGLLGDIAAARAVVGAGQVLVDGRIQDKVGSQYPVDCRLELKEKQPYVSRGGQKLAAGIDAFNIDVQGLTCADIGCSTGGFTDCLLQKGARRVYSIDVGYGVLDWKLRRDQRVIVLERTNARYLSEKQVPENLDFAVIDASFISLKLLLAPVCKFFTGQVKIVALVKPQFELAREKVARGGVVRDGLLHDEALDLVRQYAVGTHLECRGVIPSPIQGAKGNQEFLMFLMS